MEFMRHKWGYLLAAVLVILAGAALWYFLFGSGGKEYSGGLLVQAAARVKEMI